MRLKLTWSMFIIDPICLIDDIILSPAIIVYMKLRLGVVDVIMTLKI